MHSEWFSLIWERLGLAGLFLIGLVLVFKLLMSAIEKRQTSTESRLTLAEQHVAQCQKDHIDTHKKINELMTTVLADNTKALRDLTERIQQLPNKISKVS